MRLEEFEVLVNGKAGGFDGYINMEHQEEYAITIKSYSSKRCDVNIRVDGEDIGTFRLNAWGSASIERPAHTARKLTFLKTSSSEARGVAKGVVSNDRGLIEVCFRPEKERSKRWPIRPLISGGGATGQGMSDYSYGSSDIETTQCAYPINATMDSRQTSGLESGVTGLGEQSDQSFFEVEDLSTNPNDWVTINLRLVCQAEPKYAPLTPKATAIPKPV